MGKDTVKLIANNKKAWHDYFIEDKYEAGIELHGTEVKSIRMADEVHRHYTPFIRSTNIDHIICGECRYTELRKRQPCQSRPMGRLGILYPFIT